MHRSTMPRPGPAAIALGVLAILSLVGAFYYADAHVRITTDITWSEDIRPIFQQKCMPCHNPGGIAPSYVDLTTYGAEPGKSGVRDWAKAIEEEIQTGRMPPWKADGRFEQYANHRGLTKEEKQYILAWIGGGSPQGPRRGLPPPEEFAQRKWELGEPAWTAEMAEEFAIPAGKRDATTTFTFTVPDDLGLDKFGKKRDRHWITGYEFLPGNSKVVQSMQAFIIDPPALKSDEVLVEVQLPYDPLADEDALEQRRMRPLPVGTRFLGQYMRGDAPVLFPIDAGRPVRPGSTIEVRVAYRKQAAEEAREEARDRSKLGIHLAAEPLEYIIESTRIAPEPFTLKAGEAKQIVAASFAPPESVHLFGIHPRMGLLGAEAKVTAVFPDGLEKILLRVDGNQFKWPSSYYLDQPIALPAGTRIELSGRFDNSAANKENPNRPPKDVAPGAGPASEPYGEPFEAWLDYTVDDHMFIPTPTLTPPPPDKSSGMLLGRASEQIFEPTPTSSADAAPPTTVETIPNIAEALAADGTKEAIEKDLTTKEVWWCPMRGTEPGQCPLRDYSRQGKCEVCKMDLKPKSWFVEKTPPEQKASRFGSWELTPEGAEQVWWSPSRGRNGVPLKDYAEPGIDPDTGKPLLHKSQFKKPREYMCVNQACEEFKQKTVFYSPGKCPTCLEPVASMSHMDHNPVHGGLFFMAENNYHHLEGVLHSGKEFRIYFFDDMKKPLDSRNFAGKIEITKFDEKTEKEEVAEYQLESHEGEAFLSAKIPEVAEFPINLDAKIRLAGKESLFSFEFKEVTKAPDAAAAQAAGGIGGHAHVWAPPTVPADPVDVVREALKRREIVRDKVNVHAWLEIHSPAFDAKHFAEALRDKREGLTARQRDELRKAIAKVVEGAIYLEQYGHEQDLARVNLHFKTFSAGIDGLVAVFPAAGKKP